MRRGVNAQRPSQRIAVWLILLTGLADAFGLYLSRLQFASVWNGWVLAGAIPLGLVFCHNLYRMDLSASYQQLITNLGLLILFSPLGFIFSYLIASLGGAPLDDCLICLDGYLGFNWQSYHAFFLQNVYTRLFSLLFYILIPILSVLCVVALSQKRAFDMAGKGVVMIILSGLICIGISAFIPAYGAAGHYKPITGFYQGFSILIDHDYMQNVIALREGREISIRLLQPMAVIAFPSYHACLAALTVLLSWHLGRWFWWMLLLNLAGLLVIPVEGGHHLVDVLAGLLVGIFTYASVQSFAHIRR